MKVLKLEMQLQTEYTDDELAEKRDALVDAFLAIGEVELQKSASAKAFKEHLDGLYAESGKLSHQIKNRGEMRLVPCAVQMNTPNVGEKTLIRLDTGEMVRVEVMTDSERQEEIEFDVEANRDIEKLIADAHKPEPPPEPGAITA